MMQDISVIEVKEEILADNDKRAADVRERLHKRGIFMLNIMASPGSGKTSLILRTLRSLKGHSLAAVIEGDIDSSVDAEKVAKEEIPAIQLRTGGACHLDAFMIEKAIDKLDIDKLNLIIIENIGNLVCPAEFDTGASKNVMILSVPEGDDKPLKYPLMFSICDALVVNKIDYLGLSDFNMEVFRERVRKLNPQISIFEVSCKTGEGIPAWVGWLKEQMAAKIG